MTFLVMLLESMYEPEVTVGTERCVAHPVHSHNWSQSAVTDYAADMNILLAYQNCLDDWHDERRLISRAEAAVLAGCYREAAQRWPEKSRAIEQSLAELAGLERAGETDPDAGRNASAGLWANCSSTIRKIPSGGPGSAASAKSWVNSYI